MPNITIASKLIPGSQQTFQQRLEEQRAEIEQLKAIKLGQPRLERLQDLHKCLHISKKYILDLIDFVIKNVAEDDTMSWIDIPVLVAPLPPPGGLVLPPLARSEVYTLDKLSLVLNRCTNESKQDVLDKLIKELDVINRDERKIFEQIAKEQYVELSQPQNLARCEELIKIANKVKDSNPIIKESIDKIMLCNPAQLGVFFLDLKNKLPGISELAWGRVVDIISNNIIRPRTLLEEYKALKMDLDNLRVNPRVGGDYQAQLKSAEKRYNNLTDRLKRLVQILPAQPPIDISRMSLDQMLDLYKQELLGPADERHLNAEHLDEIMQSSNPSKLLTYNDLVLIEQKEREQLRGTSKAEQSCIKELLDHMAIRSPLKFGSVFQIV